MEVASYMTNFSEIEELSEKKNYSKKVPTELKLFDDTWITKKRNNMEESAHNSAYTSKSKECLSKEALEEELNKRVVARISAMKYYTPQEEEEERLLGVSTKLKLFEDPFKIKKKLKRSDLNNLSRLLVAKGLVEEHILPYFSIDCVNEIKSKKGIEVMVWDQDTESVHELTFRYWDSSESYVFNGKWRRDFVRRRNLMEGDEIGIFWNPHLSRFNFSVLNQAPRNQQA